MTDILDLDGWNVIDKFHLVRMANTAMDNVRIALAKDQSKVVGRDWMRRKVLLRMRYKNLDEKGRFNLQMWLDNEPEVAIAYRLKEAFYDIYDATTKEAGAELLDAWRASVPARMRKTKKDFKPLMTCTANWREEMLAYFDHPISNGYTEALNGVAKVINRSGRGYSFEVLRARLLFSKTFRPVEIELEDLPEPEVEVVEAPRRRAASARHELLAKQEHRCASCGGIYEPEHLYVTHMGPVMEDEPEMNLVVLCGHCKVRFHTEGVSRHGSASTP